MRAYRKRMDISMTIKQENGLTIIIPDEGKILFRDDIESELVILGKYDSPENWQEKDKEEEEVIEKKLNGGNILLNYTNDGKCWGLAIHGNKKK